MVGISVDAVERNAAMVDKLRLPFPLLSDPDGSGAIKPYQVWHEGADIARPAVVIVGPDGGEVLRQVGADPADRPDEDDLLAELRRLGLEPTSQPAPRPGAARPGPKAVELSWLPTYFSGAKGAAGAIAGRVPAAADTGRAMVAEYDRYLAALKEL